MKIADKQTRKNWIENRHMKAFNFYKKDSLEEVDIIIKTSVSYEQAKKNAVRIKIGNLRLPVISIDHLIKMKSKSNRLIDRLDILELRKIKKLKGKI